MKYRPGNYVELSGNLKGTIEGSPSIEPKKISWMVRLDDGFWSEDRKNFISMLVVCEDDIVRKLADVGAIRTAARALQAITSLSQEELLANGTQLKPILDEVLKLSARLLTRLDDN